jgi:hypothetical protein
MTLMGGIVSITAIPTFLTVHSRVWPGICEERGEESNRRILKPLKQKQAMKTSTIRTLQVGCCAVAITVFQSNCVYKPEVRNHEPGVASVTTYNPGYVVRTLPSGYQTRVVSGTTYYTSNGTYYRPHSGGYVVVEAP